MNKRAIKTAEPTKYPIPKAAKQTRKTCPECGKGKMISYGGAGRECDYCGHHEHFEFEQA